MCDWLNKIEEEEEEEEGEGEGEGEEEDGGKHAYSHHLAFKQACVLPFSPPSLF